MTNKNNNLEDFVKKMYDLSFSSKLKQYKEEDLKQIALETGMSEHDWDESRKEFKKRKQAGQQHAAHGNYDEAIKEFKHAKALNPTDFDVILGLAQAFKRKGEQTDDSDDYNRAENYAQMCIDIDPSNKSAYSLLSSINDVELQSDKKRRRYLKFIISGLGIFILILIISYISIKNNVVDKTEFVNGKWAQVENVYQRRADLIPSLVKTVKAASDFEKETLNQVMQARSEINSVKVAARDLSQENINTFKQKQDELSGALSRLLAVSEDYPELQSLKNFRDLQVQIEGSENRISVERRRFNEAVREYNSYIKKFPQSLLGFPEKGYFKADKLAKEVPAIEL